MNKAFSPIGWKNYPNESTPLNENNLKKVDEALDEIDNRVIALNAKTPFVVNDSDELCMEVEE